MSGTVVSRPAEDHRCRHSGACAAIILGKLVDQVRVTDEDCRWPAAEKARAA